MTSPDRRLRPQPRLPETVEGEPRTRSVFEERFGQFTVGQDGNPMQNIHDTLNRRQILFVSIDHRRWPRVERDSPVVGLQIYFFDDVSQELEAWPVHEDSRAPTGGFILRYDQLQEMIIAPQRTRTRH